MRDIGNIEQLCSYEEKKQISSLLLRIMQCNGRCELYTNEDSGLFNDLFLNNSVKILSTNEEETIIRISDKVIYLVRNEANQECINELVLKLESNNSIIVLNNTLFDGPRYDFLNIKSRNSLSLYGPFFDIKKKNVPDFFKVLAIIHVFNEADVIEQTTDYLISQGIDVLLIDNWSTDCSYSIIQRLSKEYPNKVFYKRFPEDGPSEFYDWYHQLGLTENISKETDYSWYIHYDADEIRVSPWKNVTLKEAIYYIDSLGFNVIENTVIDFKVTEKNDSSIFMKDTWFDFGRRPAHFEQTKTWKKCDSVDLKSSGGHIAKVKNPKVFPLKILNRHYPLRSYEHAERKIFADRKPRFEVESKKRGWHGHYNKVLSTEDIVVKKDNLYFWDADTFTDLYIPLFTGCGIEIENEKRKINLDTICLEDGESIILYGAGKMGKLLYESISRMYRIEAWVDREYEYIQPMFGRCVEDIDIITRTNYPVLLAIENENVVTSVISNLVELGVSNRRIIWKKEIFKK